MPAPACSRARAPLICAPRSATTNSPSPCASTQPQGPAYRSRGVGSRRAIAASAVARGVPATAGVGCSASARSTADVSRSSTRAVIVVARCVRSARVTGAARCATVSHAACPERLDAPRRHQPVLARVLLRAHERVGALAGAGHRPGGDCVAGAPDEQLRARADESVVGVHDAAGLRRVQALGDASRCRTARRRRSRLRARARPSRPRPNR